MGLFGPTEVVGIAEDALSFAREAARDSHPDEYMGLLRGQPASELGLDRDGVVVTDVLVVPGTKTGPTSAQIQDSLVPTGDKGMGSVHSHPNGVLQPSDEDLATFSGGRVHVILGAPYGPEDWRAFDREGRERDLEVLDVRLEDPESFFDFTQADIDEAMRRE